MGKQKKKISSKETRKLVCFLASSATATHRLADSGVSSLWPHTTLGPSQGRFSKSSHNAANPGTTAKKIKVCRVCFVSTLGGPPLLPDLPPVTHLRPCHEHIGEIVRWTALAGGGRVRAHNEGMSAKWAVA